MIEKPAEALTPPFTFHSSAYATDTNEPFDSTEFQVSSSPSFSAPEVDLYRDYEDLYGTTGANGVPRYWWVDKNEGVDIFALTVPQGVLANGQYSIRVRHRDQNLEWSPWSDPVAFTVTGSVQATPTVATDKARYAKGSSIQVQWAGGPGNATDWIGIYRDGDAPGPTASTAWTYAPSAAGSTTFTLTNSNLYWVNSFENDGYTELAKRVMFYYGDIPTLTVAQEKYDHGRAGEVRRRRDRHRAADERPSARQRLDRCLQGGAESR